MVGKIQIVVKTITKHHFAAGCLQRSWVCDCPFHGPPCLCVRDILNPTVNSWGHGGLYTECIFFPRPYPERVAVVNKQPVSFFLSFFLGPDLTRAKTTFNIFFQFQQFHQIKPIQPIPKSENPKYPNIQISKYPNIQISKYPKI